MPEQQLSFIAHDPVNALMVNLATVYLQPGPDPSVAISGSVFDHAGNGILKLYVVGLGW